MPLKNTFCLHLSNSYEKPVKSKHIHFHSQPTVYSNGIMSKSDTEKVETITLKLI